MNTPSFEYMLFRRVCAANKRKGVRELWQATLSDGDWDIQRIQKKETMAIPMVVCGAGNSAINAGRDLQRQIREYTKLGKL